MNIPQHLEKPVRARCVHPVRGRQEQVLCWVWPWALLDPGSRGKSCPSCLKMRMILDTGPEGGLHFRKMKAVLGETWVAFSTEKNSKLPLGEISLGSQGSGIDRLVMHSRENYI